MRKVMTYKESQDSKVSKKKNKLETVKPKNSEPEIIIKPMEKVAVPRFEYRLLHPDTDRCFSNKGMFIVELGKKKVELPIVGGRVITDSDEVKDKLVAQGFLLMLRKDL